MSVRRVYVVVCRGDELSQEQVCRWYESRACEIEQLCGQVDGAVQLIRLAIANSVEVRRVAQSYSGTMSVNGTVLLTLTPPLQAVCLSQPAISTSCRLMATYLWS